MHTSLEPRFHGTKHSHYHQYTLIVSIPVVLKVWSLSQSVVPGLAASVLPGNLQFLETHPRPAEPEILGVRPRNLFHQAFWVIPMRLEFENHRFTLF